MENAIVRVPTPRGHGRREADQRARGVHARRRVHPRAVGGARLLGRRGLLRPRARGRGRDGAARRRVGRRGHAVARRLAHGLAALRCRLPARASTRSPARPRSTRPTTTSSTPGTSGTAGRPLRVSPAYERLAALGAAFGEKSGWERANWFEPNAADGDESLRPRGWAGKHWSPAVGVEHRACREAVAIFDESSFAKIDVCGEPARRRSSNRSARTGSPATIGAVTYTQMLNARGGIECDFTVTRLGRGALQDRHGHRVRPARPRVDPPACPARRLGARRRRDVGARLLRRVGAERTGAAAAAHDDRPLERRLRLHAGAGALDRRRPLPRGQRDVRRRARLGAVLPRRVRRAPVGHDLGRGCRARPRRRRLQGDRLAPPREGLPRLGRRHHARGHAVRSRPRLRRQARQGRRSSVATRFAPAREPEHVLRCLTLDDPRAVALGSEPVRVGDRLVGRVTSGGYGYTVERSIAYAYLPADDAGVGTRVAVEIFGDWVGGEVAAEPPVRPGEGVPRVRQMMTGEQCGDRFRPAQGAHARRSGGRRAANGSVISSA